MGTAQDFLTNSAVTALRKIEADIQASNGRVAFGGAVSTFTFNKVMPGIIKVSVDTHGGTWVGASGFTITNAVFSGHIVPFKTYDLSPTSWHEYFLIPAQVGSGDYFDVTNGTHTETIAQVPATENDAGAIYINGDDISPLVPNLQNMPGSGDQGVITGTVVPPFQVGKPPIQPPMAARQLVIYENRDMQHGGGRLMAINPGDASGIPLPSFRPVIANPAAGTIIGEAVLNTNTGMSYIWDGAHWISVVPPAIVPYANDTTVLNDKLAPAGTYAFSQDSGNLFVRYNNGTADVWRQIGTRNFATEAGLLKTTPDDGDTGFAQDTGTVWYGDAGVWHPAAIWSNTEATIMARTPRLGQVMVATDTGRVIVGKDDGTGTVVWQNIGIQTWVSETDLLASTGGDGQIAHANDTNNLFVHSGGNWEPIVARSISTEAALLATSPAVNGVLYLARDTGNSWIRKGTDWFPLRPMSMDKATFDALDATPLAVGTQVYVTDEWVTYELNAGNTWRAMNPYVSSEANIQALSNLKGMIGVATDTGKLWINDGTKWVAQPFRDYATEAALLAATATDGVLAIATDTGKTYFRTGGNWIAVGGSTIAVGTTDPAVAGAAQGDLFFNTTQNKIKVFSATGSATGTPAWVTLGAGSLNDLSDVDTATTAPQDKETLVWDNTGKQWKPGKGGGVIMNTQPAQADRYPGMLWYSDGRTFVWIGTPACWVEI